MANYFLKNTEATRIYRIEYNSLGTDKYKVNGVYCTSAIASLPDNTSVNGVDVGVDIGNLLVELVFDTVSQATVEEYRTLAKSIIDTRW